MSSCFITAAEAAGQLSKNGSRVNMVCNVNAQHHNKNKTKYNIRYVSLSHTKRARLKYDGITAESTTRAVCIVQVSGFSQER